MQSALRVQSLQALAWVHRADSYQAAVAILDALLAAGFQTRQEDERYCSDLRYPLNRLVGGGRESGWVASSADAVRPAL